MAIAPTGVAQVGDTGPINDVAADHEAFPQWVEAAWCAADQERQPLADAGVVQKLLDSFGRWVEDELDRAVSEAGNLDGQEL